MEMSGIMNTLIPFVLQLFFCVFASFLITYLLYRRGRFTVVRKTELAILTVAGIILPIVDVFETLILLNYGLEGNPLINLTSPEYQLPFLIITHIGYGAIAFVLGLKGRSQKGALFRFPLMFLVVLEVIIVTINVIPLKLLGIL